MIHGESRAGRADDNAAEEWVVRRRVDGQKLARAVEVIQYDKWLALVVRLEPSLNVGLPVAMKVNRCFHTFEDAAGRPGPMVFGMAGVFAGLRPCAPGGIVKSRKAG